MSRADFLEILLRWTVILMGFFLSIHSAQAAVSSSNTRTCQDILASPVMPGIRGADLVRALHPKLDLSSLRLDVDRPAKIVDCDAREWRHAADAAVVLIVVNESAEESDPRGVKPPRVELALLRRSSTGLRVAARNPDALDPGALEAASTLGEPGSSLDFSESSRCKLDVASYRLTDDEYAIGIRFPTSSACAGRNAICSSFEELALFREVKDKLEMVLRLPMKAVSQTVHCDEDEDESQGCGSTDSSSYVLVVEKKRTRDFFDFTRRKVSRSCVPPPTEGFVWNGQRYKLDRQVQLSDHLTAWRQGRAFPAPAPVAPETVMSLAVGLGCHTCRAWTAPWGESEAVTIADEYDPSWLVVGVRRPGAEKLTVKSERLTGLVLQGRPGEVVRIDPKPLKLGEGSGLDLLLDRSSLGSCGNCDIAIREERRVILRLHGDTLTPVYEGLASRREVGGPKGTDVKSRLIADVGISASSSRRGGVADLIATDRVSGRTWRHSWTGLKFGEKQASR